MMTRRLIWGLVIAAAVIVVFQIFFRYDLTRNAAGELIQTDRITGKEVILEIESVDQPRRRSFYDLQNR